MSIRSGRLVVFACLSAALLVPSAWAQKGGAQQPQQPGSTPGGSTKPTPTPTQPQTQQRPGFPTMQQPVFLSGRVMMEDGMPPPERILIQRVCNGVIRPEAYTDSKGRFSFEVGRNSRSLADASVAPGFDPFDSAASRGPGAPTQATDSMGSDSRLNGCELMAILPGFRSDPVILTGRRAMDNPDVGTIVLHRIANVEGTVVSFTSMEAPKNARKAYEKGADANRQKKWQKAQKELEKAVAAYPKYAAAWYELGYALQNQNQRDEALKAYARSLEADPKYVKPYLQIAFLDAGERKWQEVADTTDRMLRLNPTDFPQAYLLNSIANLNLQRADAAEKSARAALEHDPGHHFPQIEQILGVTLANRGDFSGAIEHLQMYLKLAPNADSADAARRQLEDLRQRMAQQTANRPNQ